MIGKIGRMNQMGDRHLYKYAHCKNKNHIIHKCPKYMYDDRNGYWKYRLDKMYTLSQLFYIKDAPYNSSIKSYFIDIQRGNLEWAWGYNKVVEEIYLTSNITLNMAYAYYFCKNLKKLISVGSTPIKITKTTYFAERTAFEDFYGFDMSNVTSSGNHAFLQTPYDTEFSQNMYTLKKFSCNIENITSAIRMFGFNKNLKTLKYPVDEDGICIYESGKEQATDENNELIYNYCTLPKLSNGMSMFADCQLDRPSTISILSSLPTYTDGTHELTMGTHIDNQAEATTEGTELYTLINSTIPSKGWTLIMQYNGTLSTGVATLDLEPIYVKVIENEYGMYKNDETSICYDLSWGNSINSPDGKTPIELGYEECYSIDEIISKYNLRYVKPEEVKLPPFDEELNTIEQ